MAREILDERARFRISEHASDLRLENRGVFQFRPSRQIQKFIVRNAAPEEERETGGQLQVAQSICGAGLGICWVALDSEQELRIDEKALDSALNAGVECSRSARALAFAIEANQRLDIALGDRTPIGTTRER